MFLEAIAVLAAVRQFLPEIIALLADVETAMPNASVDAKIDMVKTIIQKTIDGIDTATLDVKSVWPVIEAVIEQHSTTPAPVAA